MTESQQAFELARKRRIRRNVALLSFTALAFYVTYILMSLK
jgi:hypothetical protein